MAPTLDQDRTFAEVLRVTSESIRLLTERALLSGDHAIALPARPSTEYPSALAATVIADLLSLAGDYVEEHTP